MNDSAQEYLNGHTNGNGKNGHDSVFGMVRKEDPVLAHVAPKARRDVILNLNLSHGARMLYCFLIDCALWTGVNVRIGVVRFANSYLGKRLGVSEKTIQNWKRELIDEGSVWTTEKRMKNSFPMTVYNVVAIVGEAMLPLNLESADGSLPEDEAVSNRTRPKPARGDHGRWARGGSELAKTPKSEESSQTAAAEVLGAKKLPSSTEENCRSERQKTSVHSGKKLPSWTEENCRGERKKTAARSGRKLPLGAEENCRGERKKTADKRESLNGVKSIERQGEAPPEAESEQNSFKDWAKSLNGRFSSQLEKMRARFIEQRKRASAAGRALLNRKISKLDQLLDGPTPEWAEPKKVSPQPGVKMLSAEELAEQGKQLVAAMRAVI